MREVGAVARSHLFMSGLVSGGERADRPKPIQGYRDLSRPPQGASLTSLGPAREGATNESNDPEPVSSVPAARRNDDRALRHACARDAPYQSDGLIRVATIGAPAVPPFLYTFHGPWLGNNIYNATGAHQSAVEVGAGSAMALGTYYTFDVSIQNDGSATDRFRVKATGATSAWVVTYSRGATNITAAVVAGTFQTPSLAPSASYLIHARITINQGGPVARLVTISSVADPKKIDAVGFGSRQ
jgi:hypothetical protein